MKLKSSHLVVSAPVSLAALALLCAPFLTAIGCAADPPSVLSGAGGSGGSDGRTPVERFGQLAVSGTTLVGANGGVVQLRGPSSMWLNWETSGFAKDPQGVQFMRDQWGATVIRAAMGVEPSGAFLTNADKARQDVRAVIDNAIALGMYVIIDWHDHTAHMHRDQAVAFFTEMAQQYGGLPNVLYEPFNEPQQVAWPTVVKPYHEAVIAAIRAVDPDNVIILGTSTWSQDVDIAAQVPVTGTNLMYTLHFYSCTHGSSVRSKADSALRAGIAIFVTEWGATHSDGGTATNPGLCLPEARLWHDWMDARAISWTAWKFDDCVDGTCYFPSGTPTTGGWTDADLNGHGAFVRDQMRQ